MAKAIVKHVLIWLSIVGLISYIAAFAYVSLFSHPIADDLSYASTPLPEGVFKRACQEYFRWGGRYTSNIFWFVNPIKHSLLAYQLSGMAIIVFLVLSTYSLLSALFSSLRKSVVILCSLLFCSLYLHNIPTTAEGLYWYTGAVGYTLGCSFVVFFFSALIYYTRGKFIIHKHVHALLLIILLFISMGFNEVISAIVVVLLFIIFFEGYAHNLKSKWLLACLLLTSVACIALLLLSPGSANRAELFTDNKDVLKTLYMGTLQTIRFVATWLTVPLIIVSIFYMRIHRQLAEQQLLFLKSFYINRWVSLGLLVLVVFISTALPYYATGILGQHRTVNVGYYFFLVFWFLNLSVWANHYQYRSIYFTTAQCAVLIALLIVGLVFSSNGFKLFTDIAHNKLQHYDKQMQERYAIIKAHQQDSTLPLEFNAISNPPQTLFVLDIQEDSRHWINESYRLYYKLEEHVKLKQ